jgi:hypothetical protein
VQNVHAMRTEVRAGYERALGLVAGDTAFATRLERFFTELRDPLVAHFHLGPGARARCGRRSSTPTKRTSTTRTPRSSSRRRVILDLANAGVDVRRLDAVPFLWKRTGTSCQNQPEVHELLQAYRALMRMAAPAVAFKAEAIVSPRHLAGYLGAGKLTRARRATSPITACSWCCCGARWPRGASRS